MSQRKSHKSKKGAPGSDSASQSHTPAPQLLVLTEMFPDWEAEELDSILVEHHNDVEIVIDLIVNNKVSKWEPIRREQKQKKRDEHILEQPLASVSNTPSHHSEHKSSGKFPRGERASKDKRREKKTKLHAPQPPPLNSASTASSVLAQASSTPSLGHGQAQAPASAASASQQSASASSANSWAAALSKDSKPKPTKKHSNVKQTNQANLSNLPKLQESQSQQEPQSQQDHHEQQHHFQQQLQDPQDLPQELPQERQQTLQQDVQLHEQEQEQEQTLQKPAGVQPTTSWASAIKPKAPSAPKKKPQPVQTEVPKPETAAPSEQAAVSQKEVSEPPVEHTIEADKAETASVHTPNVKSEVVLPQQVDNIGVSFGSLSLQKENASTEGEQQSELQTYKEQIPLNESSQTEQIQQLLHSHVQPHSQPEAEQQPQQNSQQQLTQQAARQAYQQQFEQQKSAGANQGFDYYTQFQQTQQQFPQQAAAGSIPGQFGYPSFDYSAAYGQMNQNGLGSSASPGYYQANTATTPGGKTSSSTNANGNGDSTQSPLVNVAQHGLQNPQQSQQIPGGAPFGYPNYYNYYYNTPYYGNGGAMGGVSTTAYGMQHQQYPQVQQHHQQNIGNENGAVENEASNGQSGIQAGQAASQYYAAQFYGNPNQFGTRGGYPYSGYPNNQLAPQSAHGSEPHGEQNGQQHGTPHAPGPSQPQYPQQVPQYGGYQQYPQYGSYQDSNQYRGWY